MGRQAEGPGRAWGPLRLAAAILSSCFLLTRTQHFPVKVEPSQPVKGQNVTLIPGGKSIFYVCIWYRAKPVEVSRILTYIPVSKHVYLGRNHTGRETGGPDCSMHIENLMLNDTGTYIVSKAGNNVSERGHVHLKVLAYPSIMTMGVIAGIVVGSLAGAVLLGVLFYFASRYLGPIIAQRLSKPALDPVPANQPTV